jgi:imidazolonepropionase-like amidohydrolase
MWTEARTARALLAAAAVLCPAAPARAETFAVRDVRIVTVSGPVIERGTLLVRDGRIAAVGARVSVPSGVPVIDGRGLTAYPGMIEGSTRLGLTEVSSVRATVDASEQGDLNPHLYAASAVHPHSEIIPVTRVNGVLTVLTRPAGGTIPGQSALINLAGWTIEEMAIRPKAALHIEYPSAGGGRFGGGGGGGGPGGGGQVQRRLEQLKQMLRDAQSYTPPPTGSGKRPDLALEALQPYVKGEAPVIIGADTETEIRGAIGLGEEFKLKYVLSGVREGYRVAALLKEKNVACLLGSVLSQPGGTSEAYDVLYTNPAALHKAGVRFAITSGDTANARHLPHHAAMAMAYGLPAQEALKAITLYPAQLLGIDRDYGSLESGKVANFFLATGDPLDVRTQVRAIFIKGQPVEMNNRHDDLYRKFLRRLEK